MNAPKIVERMPELNWISIDDQVWFSGNALTDGTPGDVLCVHNVRVPGNEAKGVERGGQCRATPRGIGLHTIEGRDPLTISPSLLCEVCGWHGFVRDGKWVPA
jgi:hypothetical protein